jgi:hypothetical protein
MFNVETNSGVATARIDGKYIDAARVNDTAGIEFSVERMRMADGPRSGRHADAVMSLDCTPTTLFQLATVILTKLDMPAFNEHDWRTISDALRYAASGGDFASGDHLVKLAKQIEDSADIIANL